MRTACSPKMTRMRKQRSDSAYLHALEAYLATPQGADTPPWIVRRLKQLDPRSVGIGPVPKLAQLHNTRLALEDFANEAAQHNLHSLKRTCPAGPGEIRRLGAARS